MVCWMNYEESELQPGNNRITKSKATTADLLVFESLLPTKKKKQFCLTLVPLSLKAHVRYCWFIQAKTQLGTHVQLTDTSLKWTTTVDPWHHLASLVTLYKDTSLKWTLRNGPTIPQYFSIILYKADTSLKWTPKVDPWHPFVFLLTLFETDTSFKWLPEFIPTVLQSFSLTVFKADTSIKWTPRVCPCYSSVIFFDSL